MARLVHPDRADDSEKERCTEKFKILQKIHTILTDANKRRTYDETGTVEIDEGPRVFIVSDEQMVACKENYVGEESLHVE